ncbi:hypothetical protein CEQ90_18140 [Lewinellaceae bacterium SD302]|nr:hypothetical protein CEQ90_18140 [Lewinellaceae bacterium SD302]
MQIPNLLLQSNELAQDVWWVAGAAIVLIIAYFMTRNYQKKQKTREDLPPRTRIVNDSNYNIDNTGTEDKNLGKLADNEADVVIDKMKKSDYIPSDEEFHDLRKADKS